jgi:hypothetical protein
MQSPSDTADLKIFCDLPKEKYSQANVATALQSFETSIYCVALGRWPATMGLLWQAVELLLTDTHPDLEGYDWDKESKTQFRMRRHLEECHVPAGLDKAAHEFRKFRNKILHDGFSPRDDDKVIRLFFETGVPYLNTLVKETFQKEIYTFHGTGQVSGEGWFWEIYRATKILVNKTAENEPSKLRASTAIFERACMKIVKSGGRFESFVMPYEPYEHLLGEKFSGFKFEVEKAIISAFLTELHLKSHDVVWINKLVCPICDEGLMGECEWSEDPIDAEFIALNSAGCAKCDYWITDKEAVEQLFGKKLSDEQKKKMGVQSILLVNGNEYFSAGYY